MAGRRHGMLLTPTLALCLPMSLFLNNLPRQPDTIDALTPQIVPSSLGYVA
jgi:hypothetical protein